MTALLAIVLFLLSFAPTRATAPDSFPPLTVTDITGQRHTLSPNGKSLPALFLFLASDCPYTERYTARIHALEQAFRLSGVQFFGVYSNRNETPETARNHAADWNFSFFTVHDARQTLMRQFRVTHTPEAVLLGRDGKIAYQGRIDDNLLAEKVRSYDLIQAILSVQSGRPVRLAKTRSVGSPMRWLPPAILSLKGRGIALKMPPVSSGTPIAAIRLQPAEPPSLFAGMAESGTIRSVAPPFTLVLGESPATSRELFVASKRKLPPLELEKEPLTQEIPLVATAQTPPLETPVLTTVETPRSELPVESLRPIRTDLALAKRAVSTSASKVRLSNRATAMTPAVTPVAVAKPVSRTITTSFTYTRDIAPVVFSRCLPCHRSGEIGPFPLETYEQAVKWAQQIKETTTARRMPPWKADSRGEFHDEMRLSSREIAVLAAWADGGTPFGEQQNLPPMPTFPTGWKLGQPEAILTPADEYELSADGNDVYRCFVIPTHFSEDLWVSGIEYMPGNKSVVHHVSAFIDTTGAARRLDARDPGPGYTNPTPANGPGFTPVTGQLGGWVPGHNPRKLPPGVGIRLPRGADIVLEVHYHKSGKPEKDKTQFALHFVRSGKSALNGGLPETVTKQLRIGDVSNVNFRIPPGKEDYVVEASAFTDHDITLLSVSPHMHFLGRSMRVTATSPSGISQVLIDVPAWDFRWQPSYRFKQPIKLPRRTRIDLVARFDNSEKNPNNPHRPPKEIVYGEGTNDEMCSLFLAYTQDNETSPQ